ncbi:aminomethyl-transferring glycine dehydrogenase subunit GcvPA [Pyruvatibacter mobilis]|uniref:aminomethyl-transferring glycine dehydrogenase subunit GcvPA n=1 Tax=Pyruvatibacter mobilis TaxID=1712261 RepID=UPI003D0D0F30
MRYLPLTADDRLQMLGVIGAKSIDDLFVDVPEAARIDHAFDLPPHQGELEVERALSAMAAKNVSAGTVPFFVGAGAYKHHVPATVDHLIQRSEFLTSYTPYQPEISQGTLQYLFEFQTQVALLTGMEVANASMYDGSTACSEAVQMAHRVTRRTRAVLSGNLHPHYRAVIETNSKFAGDAVVALEADVAGAEDLAAQIDGETSCVVVQYPDFFGNIQDLSAIAAAAHEQGALLIVAIPEIVSMGALRAPGEMGADIVVAEGQSIGNALNFGGPYVGLFATRQKYVRQMPGRLAGETVDVDGRRGYVLTLSTREQHIRREKATSNICTNSGLCCLAFTIHLSLLGEQGFTRLAAVNHESACKLAGDLEQVAGVEVLTPAFFNEFTIRTPKPAAGVIDALAEKGVLGGVPASRLMPGNEAVRDLIIVAATEVNTDADRAAYKAALAEVLS